MFEESSSPVTVQVAVKQLADALDQLLSVDLTAASRDELLSLARGVEVQRRRLPVADHAVIGELQSRGVAGELGCPSTAVLLSQLLVIARGEAAERVKAAADIGPRRTLTGQPVDPVFPLVAEAQAEGAISDRHAAVIRRTVHHLPVAVRAEHEAAVEEFLTAQARVLDPGQLARLAQRLRDTLDPDGTLTDDADHARRRDFTMHTRPDGSGRASIELTPAGVAITQAWLDALSAPVPAADGEPDRRTAGQRRYDAFEDLGRRALRGGELPDCGGTPATLLITITLDQLESRAGIATTSHGGLISVPEALRLAGEADLIPVVLGDTGGVLAHGRSRRVASSGQRLALAARDGGCSFPSCDRPPSWCQSHHIVPWIDGGPTDLDNLTLVCGYHHREFARRGWACRIIDGVPHWIPPAWWDRARSPRRNTAHDTELR